MEPTFKSLDIPTTRKHGPIQIDRNMSKSRRGKPQKIDKKLTYFCHFGQITVNLDIITQVFVTLDNFLSILCVYHVLIRTCFCQFGPCFLVLTPCLKVIRMCPCGDKKNFNDKIKSNNTTTTYSNVCIPCLSCLCVLAT